MTAAPAASCAGRRARRIRPPLNPPGAASRDLVPLAGPPPHPREPADDAGEIHASLALGLRLVTAAEAFSTGFAFEELGDIELPPSAGSAADQANLRAIAPLYLAAELEAARLLPAVEVLAGVFVSGGLPADLGSAAEPLAQFWRTRRERLSAAERRGFFAGLFGHDDGPPLASEHGSNHGFEDHMISLAEALYKLGEGGPAAQARVRTTAAGLAENLVPRAAGLVAFAARDILETTHQAVQILQQSALQQAIGARSLWLAVRLLARRYLRENPAISERVTRGKAGLLVLAWLAEVLPQLDTPGSPLVQPDDPVIPAAAAWLEASLDLHEQRARRLNAR